MLEITTVKNQAEFAEFDKILSEFYGKSHNSSADFKMWNQYPSGSIVLKVNSKIVGGMNLYPVKSESIDKFLDGKISDSHLDIDDTDKKNWNIFDYIILKECRKPSVLIRFAFKTLDYWYSYQKDNYPITVTATPSTKNGVKGLKLLKFKKYKNFDDNKLPIYRIQLHNRLELKYYILSVKVKVLLIAIKYVINYLSIKRLIVSK